MGEGLVAIGHVLSRDRPYMDTIELIPWYSGIPGNITSLLYYECIARVAMPKATNESCFHGTPRYYGNNVFVIIMAKPAMLLDQPRTSSPFPGNKYSV